MVARRWPLFTLLLVVLVAGAAALGRTGGPEMARAAAATTPDDGLSHPKVFKWYLLGSTPDERAVRIFAAVDHGGCSYPQARVKRTSVGRVSIRVFRARVKCTFETAELRFGAVLTVGLPVKSSVEEVRVGGPGYSGVRADPLAREGQPQRYPGVGGLDLRTARRVLKANGITDVSLIGNDRPTATVRLQWPAAGAVTYTQATPPGESSTPVPAAPLRPATLVVMPAGTFIYPWPKRFTCEQYARLTPEERLGLDDKLAPFPACPA